MYIGHWILVTCLISYITDCTLHYYISVMHVHDTIITISYIRLYTTLLHLSHACTRHHHHILYQAVHPRSDVCLVIRRCRVRILCWLHQCCPFLQLVNQRRGVVCKIVDLWLPATIKGPLGVLSKRVGDCLQVLGICLVTDMSITMMKGDLIHSTYMRLFTQKFHHC